MEVISKVLSIFVLFMCVILFWMWFCFGNCVNKRQKTRNPQQRRLYVGSRARPSLDPQEPSIYVSPSNMPPPPKYDFIAPPSYDEVVGTHYPGYQQPISLPITTALQAQSTSQDTGNRNGTDTRTETVVTVPDRTVTASA